MPPTSTNRIDERGAELVADWIRHLGDRVQARRIVGTLMNPVERRFPIAERERRFPIADLPLNSNPPIS